MTFEQMQAKLAAEGWSVWHLGVSSRGQWSCRIVCFEANGRRTPRGPAGYDRDEMWRDGCGPTPVAAMSAAALRIFPQPTMEVPLDLASMLS